MFKAWLLLHVVHEGWAEQHRHVVHHGLLHDRVGLDPVRGKVFGHLRAKRWTLLLVPQGINSVVLLYSWIPTEPGQSLEGLPESHSQGLHGSRWSLQRRLREEGLLVHLVHQVDPEQPGLLEAHGLLHRRPQWVQTRWVDYAVHLNCYFTIGR